MIDSQQVSRFAGGAIAISGEYSTPSCPTNTQTTSSHGIVRPGDKLLYSKIVQVR